MNQKEVSELRRRFRPEKNAIRRIYGCYVNSKKEIISYLDIPLGTAPQEEVEQYFQLLKKALSGTLGKQLIDMIFSTQQVADSPEHRLLSALYRSGLKDSAAREEFYQKVIQSLDFEGRNYVILLAHDTYDVPHQEGSGEDGTEDTVFSYFLCAICPVKDGKRELGYCPGEHEFHSQIPGQIISPPELGFLFPAFDNRTANLYNALFYTRTPSMLYHDFLDAVFHTEPPMSAAEQREAFQSALCNGLGEGCSIDVIHAVHEQLWEKLEEHKSCGDPEPLALTPQALGHVLQDCGVPQTQIAEFQTQCSQQFGDHAALNPANLIDAKRFEVKTPTATLSVDLEHSTLIETRVIEGRKYLLVPIEADVEINGLPLGKEESKC